MLFRSGKIADFPIVIMGKGYWDELDDFLLKRMVADGTISAADRGLWMVTDDPVEAAQFITDAAEKRFGLRRAVTPKKRWWLFER